MTHMVLAAIARTRGAAFVMGRDILWALVPSGGDVAAPTPHRPGRADFPHPVLHERASLAAV